MSRIFIAPLGFHEDIILRSLIALRASCNDIVYVITCEPVSGAVKRAFDSLIALTSRQGFPQPLLIELDCNSFYASVKKVRDVLKKHESDEIILCTGGGLRALTLITLLSLISLKRVFTLHYEPETGVEKFTIRQEFFLNIFKDLSKAERKALELVIKQPGISVKELSTILNIKEKTVRNLITRLKKRGLVVKKGRREGVEPSEISLALFT
ncbi:MAG: CRISPR-associated CARF protein Csa3 [Desulfurococcaceae archaeon]